jgi:WD40 repeat protein
MIHSTYRVGRAGVGVRPTIAAAHCRPALTTFRLRWLALVLGALCLCTEVGRSQETFPFSREFKDLKGEKAAARFGDDGADEIAFSPDSRYLLARKGAKLTLWDVRERKAAHAWELKVPKGVDVTSMSVAPDGKSLAVSTSDGIVSLFDLATDKKVLRSWRIPDKKYPNYVVFGDGGRIAVVATQFGSGDAKSAVYVWELSDEDDKPRHAFTNVGGFGPYRAPVIAFLPPQKKLLLSGSEPGASGPFWKAALLDLESGKTVPLTYGYLVTASRDGSMWMAGLAAWTRDTYGPGRDPAGQLKLPQNRVLSAYALCPKGRFLVAVAHPAGSFDLPDVLVWTVDQNDERVGVAFKERVRISELPGKSARVSVAFSPDGATLVVASDKEILVWDARALLPVADPIQINEDLREEIRGLREQVQSLERRVKELESKK